ncbi:uncharacterized protein [Dermacentor albipictus]|uniref:uncharacterized protein n=1 Tax=Dermacentor albipictus TaxID=60249 RepID=UPI0031FE4230
MSRTILFVLLVTLVVCVIDAYPKLQLHEDSANEGGQVSLLRNNLLREQGETASNDGNNRMNFEERDDEDEEEEEEDEDEDEEEDDDDDDDDDDDE